jgi:hypothetical protein
MFSRGKFAPNLSEPPLGGHLNVRHTSLRGSSSKSAKNSPLKLNISFDMCNFRLFVMKTSKPSQEVFGRRSVNTLFWMEHRLQLKKSASYTTTSMEFINSDKITFERL